MTNQALGARERRRCGTAVSVIGILANILLFGVKFLAGTLLGSISVRADAMNNLSDAGSSVIALAGFRLAGKKPDKKHPFGHGRTEYISGLVIAFVIALMGFELAKSSVAKIITPESVDFSWVAAGILAASVCVKVYMFAYNRRIGKMIDSASLLATSKDSLSDCVSTCASLAALFVSKIWGVSIDGYVGAVVSLFILWSAFGAAKDTVLPLLGSAADPEFVAKIRERVLSYDCIIGIHDLIVHDYGPGRVMVSLHAEVCEDCDIVAVHEVIDRAEREAGEELGCHIVIHMDPIAVDDIELEKVRSALCGIISSWQEGFSIHDFRVVRGKDRTNFIFDVVVPFESEMSEDEVRERLSLAVHGMDGRYYAVINIDRPFH